MARKTPFLIVFTIILAAITTVFLPIIITTTSLAYHRHHHLPNHPEDPPPLDFPSNAAQYLQSNGFNFIANLIHISPELFLSTPESTIFAIPDSVMSNLSIPPYMTIQLIAYHVSPNKFTIQDLFQKPLNTCLITMFQQQKISITKKDEQNKLVEINNVLISKPDMFLHGSVAIHGVNGPFASFQFHTQINELPVCSSSSIRLSNNNSDDLMRIRGEWKSLVKFLGSSGFTPFAFWLYNVLDGIVKDHPHLHSMTIFAPPIIEVMPASVMHNFLRSYMVPKKHSFKHLVSMSEGPSILTLCPFNQIKITGTVVNLTNGLLSVNGVEITSPDLFSSRSFVVHGIARPFSIDGIAEL